MSRKLHVINREGKDLGAVWDGQVAVVARYPNGRLSVILARKTLEEAERALERPAWRAVGLTEIEFVTPSTAKLTT